MASTKLRLAIDAASEKIDDLAMEPGADHPKCVRQYEHVQEILGIVERRSAKPGYRPAQASADLEWIGYAVDLYAAMVKAFSEL